MMKKSDREHLHISECLLLLFYCINVTDQTIEEVENYRILIEGG